MDRLPKHGEEYPQEFGVAGATTRICDFYVVLAPLAQALAKSAFMMAGIAITRKVARLRCVW